MFYQYYWFFGIIGFLVFVLNYWFFGIIAILPILLELLVNRTFTNIIGIIAISNNFTNIIGNLKNQTNIIAKIAIIHKIPIILVNTNNSGRTNNIGKIIAI